MRPLIAAMIVILLAAKTDAMPVRVFVMAGQSNMVGGGDVDDLPSSPVDLSEPQEDVLYHYRLQTTELGVATQWIPLKPLLQEVRGTTYGPEISFGRDLADQLPGTQIAIIKVAANGTNLRENWHPSGENGSLYQAMLDHVSNALQLLENDGFVPSIGGFVWVQGNGDTANEETGAEYEENLNALIAAVRNDWNTSNLPVLFNQLHIDSNRPSPGVAAVRQSQANVAANDPRAIMINIDDLALKSDNVHFPGPTHLELGYRFADAYLVTIPEPGGLVLLVVGVVLLGLRRVRRTDG